MNLSWLYESALWTSPVNGSLYLAGYRSIWSISGECSRAWWVLFIDITERQIYIFNAILRSIMNIYYIIIGIGCRPWRPECTPAPVGAKREYLDLEYNLLPKIYYCARINTVIKCSLYSSGNIVFPLCRHVAIECYTAVCVWQWRRWL